MASLQQTRRRRLYGVILVVSALFMGLGLWLNTASIPLNDKIQKLHRQLKIVRDENRDLRAQFLNETRLSRVDAIATDMGMHRPTIVNTIIPHAQLTLTKTP